jgi:hypothetical protein
VEYIVFQISGGIGKNVIATSVVRAIQTQYPEKKIIILTAHPDIWIGNPRIHKVLQFGQTAYFYDDYIKDKDTLIFTHDPYGSADSIYRRKHLSQIWCELYGITWQGEKPELYFSTLEMDQVSELINKTKPILIIQPFGGAQTHNRYSWMRDIPPHLAQQIVDEFKNEYRVIQVKREDQIGLNGVEYLSMNPRILALSLFLADKRVLIDSYLQHASAALGLESYVFWIGNSPTALGYESNKNIVTQFEVGSTRNSLYDPFDISGDPMQLATPPNNLFDPKSVIEIIRAVEYKGPQMSQSNNAPSIEVPSLSNNQQMPDITDVIPGIVVTGFSSDENTVIKQTKKDTKKSS